MQIAPAYAPQIGWKTVVHGLATLLPGPARRSGIVASNLLVPLLDPAAVAEAAAEIFVASADSAVARQDRFVVALSGGSTPRRLYELLAAPPYRDRIPWDRTVVVFGDERCVPAEHRDSNYRMARETLLDHVPLERDRVLPMAGHLANPHRAALFYENGLKALFPDQAWPSIDLVLLGVGEDGHTASLFPGTEALKVDDRWVVANYVSRLESWRITLTLPVLNHASMALFLVTGEAKAQIVAEAFGNAPHDGQHPCELVVPLQGDREILLDQAAASKL